MLSIVLSSCGKESKTFVRYVYVSTDSPTSTAPTTTPPPAPPTSTDSQLSSNSIGSQSLEALAEALSLEAQKKVFEPPSKACLKALKKCPTRDCSKVLKRCSKDDLNPPTSSEVASVVKAPSVCNDVHTRCHESLQKASPVLDCASEDLNCVEDLISLNNSTVPKHCSSKQRRYFAVYGVPFKNTPPPFHTCSFETYINSSFPKNLKKNCVRFLQHDYRSVALAKMYFIEAKKEADDFFSTSTKLYWTVSLTVLLNIFGEDVPGWVISAFCAFNVHVIGNSSKRDYSYSKLVPYKNFPYLSDVDLGVI